LEDFEAEIKILSAAEGGKRKPTFNGIRWDFIFVGEGVSQQIHMIWPEFIDEKEEVIPVGILLEGTLKARMYVVDKEMRRTYRNLIHEGLEFFCVEGSKKVANGKVLKVTGLLKDD
jgi:translation elongation factor EF-Tu-like GTPase